MIGLAACGDNFTGGSIPTGGTGRIAGMVVRGDNTRFALAGSRVRIEPQAVSRAVIEEPNKTPTDDPPDPPPFPPPSGGGNGGQPPPVVPPAGTVEVGVNLTGQFSVEGVRAGPVEVTILPPGNSGLAPMTLEVTLRRDEDLWIMAAPMPANLNLAGLSGIAVEPERLNLRVGAAEQLVVRRFGGAPPMVAPSYVVSGGVGVVNAEGRFAAIQPSQGVIHVLLGPYEEQVPVTVR